VLWPQGAAGGVDGVATVIVAGAALALFRLNWGVMTVLAVCAALGLAVRMLTPALA